MDLRILPDAIHGEARTETRLAPERSGPAQLAGALDPKLPDHIPKRAVLHVRLVGDGPEHAHGFQLVRRMATISGVGSSNGFGSGASVSGPPEAGFAWGMPSSWSRL